MFSNTPFTRIHRHHSCHEGTYSSVDFPTAEFDFKILHNNGKRVGLSDQIGVLRSFIQYYYVNFSNDAAPAVCLNRCVVLSDIIFILCTLQRRLRFMRKIPPRIFLISSNFSNEILKYAQDNILYSFSFGVRVVGIKPFDFYKSL